MTGTRGKDGPTDEELVAYLDGELSPDARARMMHRIATDHDLQQRLILLSGGNRPFRAAFEPLLEQVPRARLEAMLASLPVSKSSSAGLANPDRMWGSGMRAAIAGLLLFLGGLGSGWIVSVLIESAQEQMSTESLPEDEEWRQIVAEYLALYTSETLAGIPDNATLREQEIATIGAKIGLSLSAQKIALPDLILKRAQLLEYDHKPLGQVAYLDPKSGPVALCITANGSSVVEPQTEQRQGFNIVYWSRGAHRFMLIGKAEMPRLQEFASILSTRLA